MQLASVFDTSWLSLRVVAQRFGRYVNLVGEEAKHDRWDRLAGRPSETRMTKQRHLHCAAQLVGGTSALIDPFEIVR